MAVKAVRVSRTVPVLVMMANYGQHSAEGFQRLADRLAILGMPLHHIPFRGSEFAALLETPIRNLDFSQIMQITAPLESDDVLVIKAQVTPQFAGIMRQPGAMITGVRITGFDSQGQGEEDSLGILQLISEMFQLQQALDARIKFFGIQGLGEEVICAGFDASHSLGSVAQAGNPYDGNQPGGGSVLELTAEIIRRPSRQDHF